jgi:hypothetical protein
MIQLTFELDSAGTEGLARMLEQMNFRRAA